MGVSIVDVVASTVPFVMAMVTVPSDIEIYAGRLSDTSEQHGCSLFVRSELRVLGHIRRWLRLRND